jgi:uncharacterized membrane protein YhaH (DUF805 family)
MPLLTFPFLKMNLCSLNGNTPNQHFFWGAKFHIVVIFLVKDEYFMQHYFVLKTIIQKEVIWVGFAKCLFLVRIFFGDKF